MYRGSQRGKPKNVAYEDIRLKPKGEPTNEFMKIERDEDAETTNENEEQQGLESAEDLFIVPSIITSSRSGKPQKDIGNITVGMETVQEDLLTDEQQALQEVKKIIGTAQVSFKKYSLHRHGWYGRQWTKNTATTGYRHTKKLRSKITQKALKS